MHNATRDDGFTLIELMIVIAILGILAGMVTFAAGPMLSHARDARIGADARTCLQASEMAQASNAIHADQRTANDFVEGGSGC